MSSQPRTGLWWRRPIAGLALRVMVLAARDHMPYMADGVVRCMVCGVEWPCEVRTETDARVARFHQ